MQVLEHEQSEEKEDVEQMFENMPMSAGDPIATAAAGSVILSWFLFYVRGNKEHGLFVGLWAPTLLAGASYLQQKDLMRKTRKALSSF